jgi:toxin YoeB
MVRFKIEWSCEARLDLIDILDYYIKRNKSNVYSIKLNAKINRSLKQLTKNPFLGIPTDYESVRIIVTGHYQIIYEIFDQLILVIMIWDCRRNPDDRAIEQRRK